MKIGNMQANRISLSGPKHHGLKVWHLPTWKNGDDRSRMKVLRKIALHSGRDPRMAHLAVQIVKNAGAQPRDYKAQAAALLKWVQNKIFYINEAGERLQDPFYTIKHGYGDCDDMALVLASLLESIRLEWRFVLSGSKGGKTIRWVEGTPLPRNARWSHIYLMVGWPPFKPKRWAYCEPTLKTAALGWDVVQGIERGENFLPELGEVPPYSQSSVMKLTPHKEDKYKDIKEQFKMENILSLIVTDVMVAAVTSVLVGRLIDLIEKRVFGEK